MRAACSARTPAASAGTNRNTRNPTLPPPCVLRSRPRRRRRPGISCVAPTGEKCRSRAPDLAADHHGDAALPSLAWCELSGLGRLLASPRCCRCEVSCCGSSSRQLCWPGRSLPWLLQPVAIVDCRPASASASLTTCSHPACRTRFCDRSWAGHLGRGRMAAADSVALRFSASTKGEDRFEPALQAVEEPALSIRLLAVALHPRRRMRR